ncbi:hypothetical protein H8356DRAFT_1733908 [Neocallimastix lanati (nom. inval.)]|nr:hypothetical protein H8356DRAFT_1733908 [Neocallimastix sp. JGI-2020a]
MEIYLPFNDYFLFSTTSFNRYFSFLDLPSILVTNNSPTNNSLLDAMNNYDNYGKSDINTASNVNTFINKTPSTALADSSVDYNCLLLSSTNTTLNHKCLPINSLQYSSKLLVSMPHVEW